MRQISRRLIKARIIKAIEAIEYNDYDFALDYLYNIIYDMED